MSYDPHAGLRRSITRLAAAVTSSNPGAASTDSLAMLDGLGFGNLSSAIGEDCRSQDDEPTNVQAECNTIRPFGPAVTLPVLAVLAEVATSDRCVTDDA